MALHERFSDYTVDEISKIKRDICLKHKCPYLGSVSNLKSQIPITGRCCNYFLFTGKMRGCMPDECMHYNDTDVKHKRFVENDIPLKKKDYVYIE